MTGVQTCALPIYVPLWLDLLNTTPSLLMRELLCEEEDGGVRVSYKNVESLVLWRGDDSETVGTWGGGVISHSLPNTNPGDWVVAEYYVRRSFVLTAHNSLTYYGTEDGAEAVKVSYEGSIPDILKAVQLSDGQTLNFNPLFPDSFRVGYLSHIEGFTNPASGLWTPAKILLEVDKSVATPGWGEMVKFTALVLDSNDLPIPWFPVTVSLTSGASGVVTTPTSTTDGRGEVHGLFVPKPSGDTVVTLSAGTLTATAKTTAAAVSISQTTYLDGHTFAVVERTKKTPRNNRRAYAAATTLDGIPRVAASIELRSRLSSELETADGLGSGSVLAHPLRTLDNPFALSEDLGFTPQTGDELIARAGTAQSPILEF